jgi:hypothetical protein
MSTPVLRSRPVLILAAVVFVVALVKIGADHGWSGLAAAVGMLVALTAVLRLFLTGRDRNAKSQGTPRSSRPRKSL